MEKYRQHWIQKTPTFEKYRNSISAGVFAIIMWLTSVGESHASISLQHTTPKNHRIFTPPPIEENDNNLEEGFMQLDMIWEIEEYEMNLLKAFTKIGITIDVEKYMKIFFTIGTDYCKETFDAMSEEVIGEDIDEEKLSLVWEYEDSETGPTLTNALEEIGVYFNQESSVDQEQEENIETLKTIWGTIDKIENDNDMDFNQKQEEKIETLKTTWDTTENSDDAPYTEDDFKNCISLFDEAYWDIEFLVDIQEKLILSFMDLQEDFQPNTTNIKFFEALEAMLPDVIVMFTLATSTDEEIIKDFTHMKENITMREHFPNFDTIIGKYLGISR